MKDKIAGYSIFLFSLAVLGAYWTFTIWGLVDWVNQTSFMSQQATIILIAAPILLGLLVILAIAAWIGWTMARTPPPAPIDLEDFESIEETESKAEK